MPQPDVGLIDQNTEGGENQTPSENPAKAVVVFVGHFCILALACYLAYQGELPGSPSLPCTCMDIATCYLFFFLLPVTRQLTRPSSRPPEVSSSNVMLERSNR